MNCFFFFLLFEGKKVLEGPGQNKKMIQCAILYNHKCHVKIIFKAEVVTCISIPSPDFVTIDDEIVGLGKYIYLLSVRELDEKIH